MILKLKNNFNKKEYEFPAFDIKDSRIFYHFSIKLPEGIEDGEYTYFLEDDEGVLLASSLLQIGDYKQTNTVYTTDNNGYKVYNG